jgi:hypothetical protein
MISEKKLSFLLGRARRLDPHPHLGSTQPPGPQSPSGPSGARTAWGRGLPHRCRRRRPRRACHAGLGVRAYKGKRPSHARPSPASSPSAASHPQQPRRRNRAEHRRPPRELRLWSAVGASRERRELHRAEPRLLRCFPSRTGHQSTAAASTFGRRWGPPPATLPPRSAGGEHLPSIPSISSPFPPPWTSPWPLQSPAPPTARTSLSAVHGRPEVGDELWQFCR